MTQTSVSEIGLWRFSVSQYHQMQHHGILSSEDKVELLEGWVVEKMPKNPPHTVATALARAFFERLGGFYVLSQDPITLADSEPEPDLAIVRGNLRDYSQKHPEAEDVLLILEVSDSTLERDRTWKKQIYAQAGIGQYWILNLQMRQLEMYGNPVNGEYPKPQIFEADEELLVRLEEEHVINVKDLLP